MVDQNSGVIKLDTNDLNNTILAFQSAVTNAFKNFNSASDQKKSNFEAALQSLISRSIDISSTRLRDFHQSSLKTMNSEVLKYEQIINGTLVQIEKSKFVQQAEKKGVQFEEHEKKSRDSQEQLISQQKQAFVDFKDALKVVANRLLTVSGMFDKADQLQDRKNYTDDINLPFKDFSTLLKMGSVSHGVEEVYLRDALKNIMKLFEKRHEKDFDQNELIQALSRLPGQEHLIEELKKISDKDPMAFIKLMMQAMSKGVNDKSVDKGIEDNITTHYGTKTFLKDESVFKTDKTGFNLFNWALGQATIEDNNLSTALGVSTKNSIKKEEHEVTKTASTAQSGPALNAWNDFWSYVMEKYPDMSKTFLSIGALGSVLDDIYGEIKPIVGAALAMKLSMKVFSLSTTSLSTLMLDGLPAVAFALARFTLVGGILALLYESAKTAANTTTDGVNGMYGSLAVPRAQTPEEVAKSKEKIEKDKQQDWERNAPYMSLVNQNMRGQKLTFNKEWNEYQYVDSKTGKIANMGMVGDGLDPIKHAHDEWEATSEKRKKFEEKTGAKLIMVPKDRGWFNKRGSIEFVAMDANGNQLANFKSKLNMPIQDMINKLPIKYQHYSNPTSRLPVIDANAPRIPPVISKMPTKDQFVNQGLSVDMNKIREQMSTSLQLSKQLLNTPNTMQQRFNFYFTLPQTNSGRIEHSFENNSVVPRKGGGSLSNVDKAYPNFGANGTLV